MCDGATVQVNAEPAVPATRSAKGGFALARDWKAGDTVTLDLPMAWMAADRSGSPVDVVFTEFADPSGREIYFRLPAGGSPIPLVDDEMISL